MTLKNLSKLLYSITTKNDIKFEYYGNGIYIFDEVLVNSPKAPHIGYFCFEKKLINYF